MSNLGKALLCLAAIALSAGVVTAKNRDVKVKAKGAKERIDPGGTGTVTVSLKNRTKEPQTVTVTLRYRDIEDAEPIGSVTLTLAPKERVFTEFEVAVPVDWFDKRLRVVATIPDATAKTRIRTRPADFTDELWLRGQALYRAECGARCHGGSGGQVRSRSLSTWISAIRGGPGSMPRYPGLSRTDIVLMRLYARDGKRQVD